ncbi:MAG TPA: DUF1972 domain-containing protein [Bacteroidia bacterium]|nr:DUF1972 domain-containing protein [Bacteroidia bacterium]
MKIAIAGTRGIPNKYGGFEQCAQYLSELLVQMGHEVTVYNTHYHPWQKSMLGDVHIVKKFNPENTIGTAGNFIYDFLCMRHAVSTQTDVLLVLGYTTASVFYPLMRWKSAHLVTNMDGLEWKRDKWNGFIKRLAKWFEKLGANYSPWLISDNPEIAAYLKKTYNRSSYCIAYGCNKFTHPDPDAIRPVKIKSDRYGVLIARMEPENNIEMALEGFAASDWDGELIVVGDTGTRYGKKMKALKAGDGRIHFTGGIYDQELLNNLRYYSSFYIHGHSVGGTNPSLLEAMACGCLILMHGNNFNKSVTEGNAHSFVTAAGLTALLNQWDQTISRHGSFREGNYKLVSEKYNWKVIAEKYEACFREITGKK